MLPIPTVACLALLGLSCWEGCRAEPLFITRLGGKVAPERVVTAAADEAGDIEVCWRGSGHVEKGTLLARVNPDAHALEEAELELQIAQLKLEADNEVLQLMRQKEEMEFIASLPSQQRPYISQRLETPPDERALALLEEKIRLVRERFHLQEQKARETFAKKAALRLIRMPFSGRVQFHLTPPPEGQRAPIAAGAPVLTAADDSSLYIACLLADPALTHLDPSRLSVRLEGGGGETLHAAWSHKRVEKQGQSEALVYYFLVPISQAEHAWNLLGSNIVVELWCQGDEGWLYEEKAALALEAGDKSFETWEELTAALRPGYAIVFSGETHLALRPSNPKEEQ